PTLKCKNKDLHSYQMFCPLRRSASTFTHLLCSSVECMWLQAEGWKAKQIRRKGSSLERTVHDECEVTLSRARCSDACFGISNVRPGANRSASRGARCQAGNRGTH